ncbi:hypothetical protein JTB14_010893 [Gonioctena quinquepunctata]|nr:hypothetical protein JTB14_010893 [Gonioctena quinquepunctata]
MQADKKTQNVSDERKFRKPLMEKKRRARINESLDNLKQILLECDPENVSKKSAKLEKADILEMTVSYLQNIRKKEVKQCYYQSSNYGYYTPSQERYYPQNSVKVPPKSSYGSQYYHGGAASSKSYSQQKGGDAKGVWRPW